MYFWRIEELKSKMKSAPLSERETLPYFLVFLLSTEFASLIPSPPTMNYWDYATIIYGAALTLLGTLYLYRLNGGNGGAFFVQRYLALGWVTALRVIAGALPAFVVLNIFIRMPNDGNGFSFGYFALVGLFLYQRLGRHIHDIASNGAAI
ncbi:hypothetical protein HZA56_21515 [Candidatus Poribacteria bacterium]|nr:hypothetical protein [Candidatus Poribacteria bacterium]